MMMNTRLALLVLLSASLSLASPVDHSSSSSSSSSTTAWTRSFRSNWPTASKFPPMTDFNRRYAISSVLGQGNFGTVYLAKEKSTSRQVAIKCAHEPQHNNMAKSSFYTELYLLQLLDGIGYRQHSRLLNHFTAQGHARADMGNVMLPRNECLVLEYVKGKELQKTMEEEVDSVKDVQRMMDYGLEVLRGLKLLASVGISHNDLTPDNIMVDTSDRVRVLDFGLAGIDASLCPSTPLEACKEGNAQVDADLMAPYLMPLKRKERSLVSMEYSREFDAWLEAKQGRQGKVERLRELLHQGGGDNLGEAITVWESL